MSVSTHRSPQTDAETDKKTSLQAQLDQATTKIAELKAEMEKCGEEIIRTTQTVLDTINQQQRKASQQAAEDYAKAKQSMLEELTAAQKKLSYNWKRQTADSRRQKTDSIPS